METKPYFVSLYLHRSRFRALQDVRNILIGLCWNYRLSSSSHGRFDCVLYNHYCRCLVMSPNHPPSCFWYFLPTRRARDICGHDAYILKFTYYHREPKLRLGSFPGVCSDESSFPLSKIYDNGLSMDLTPTPVRLSECLENPLRDRSFFIGRGGGLVEITC